MSEEKKEKTHYEPEQLPEGKKKAQEASEADQQPEACAPPDIIIEN
jgi:hypothetical protein